MSPECTSMEFIELIKTTKVDGVRIRTHPFEMLEGTLCITGHHLLLSTREDTTRELWLLHRSIDALEAKPFLSRNTAGGIITLKYKNLRVVTLEMKFDKEYLNVVASLEALRVLNNPTLEYPFFYRPIHNVLEDGYKMYSVEMEFSRLQTAVMNSNLKGICCPAKNDNSANPVLQCDKNSNVEPPSCEWRITYINKDFRLCPTYAAALIVPKLINDEKIIQSASFREGGRFPILSYVHTNGAVLLRSSQPVPSTIINRCRADEAILNIVLGRNRKGFIVDTWCRDKSIKEIDQYYKQWTKVYRSIGNISSPAVILDSFAKLIEACNDNTFSMDKWISRLANSHWLTLVLNSLNVSCMVAQCLDQENSPVLVYDAKGLDSTLIVTSLTQIILHPDYRTIRGLQALIEREWIQAGYPFATRHRYSCYTAARHRPKSAGATFALFLDCIHQLYKQFPCSFEFNSQLLVLLFDHSYSSEYGTFMCDSERERHELQLHLHTTSLWSHINRPDVLKTLINVLYEPNAGVIWPSVAPISLDLWTVQRFVLPYIEMYLRWRVDQTYFNNNIAQIYKLISSERELRLKVYKLRNQTMELSRKISDGVLNTI